MFVATIFVPATLIPVVLYSLLYWKVKKLKQADASAKAGGRSAAGNGNVAINKSAAITFFLLFFTAFVLTSPFALVVVFVERQRYYLVPKLHRLLFTSFGV